MKKIATHLWFDKEAKEAAEFYVETFGGNSTIQSTNQLHDTPSGDVDVVVFNLLDAEFQAISAGPLFKFNPSISFTVNCKTKEEVDMLWGKLSPGGFVMMPLQKWPFSEWYGWVQDKYGLSWQIGVVEETRQKIVPSLMFTGQNFGRCEEAINFYTSVFKDGEVKMIARYEEGEHDVPGKIKYSLFKLNEQLFVAMESSLEHKFNFNEAISIIVTCEDQKEIDYYWEKLSAVPEAEQCGWLKDKFGVSWQIVPAGMAEMLASGDKEKVARVTEAFLKMKKFDIAELERAAAGE